MAPSNLKIGLQRRYARWLGESLQLTKDIKDIEEAAASLEEKKQRLTRIADLTRATETLMSELDPDWKPEDVLPQKTNKQVLPFEHGAVTSMAFDILRELSEPISTLELSKLTLARLGSDPNDPDLLDRVRSNLDNSLRNAKDYIENVGGRPSRWKIKSIDEMAMPKAPS
jgi:hypothetical protein